MCYTLVCKSKRDVFLDSWEVIKKLHRRENKYTFQFKYYDSSWYLKKQSLIKGEKKYVQMHIMYSIYFILKTAHGSRSRVENFKDSGREHLWVNISTMFFQT